MIPVFYDANAIFVGSDRDRVYPAGTLKASASGDHVVIDNLHSTQAIIDAHYSQISDIGGSTFPSAAACVAYLSGEFEKRRLLGSYYRQDQPSDTWTIAHGLGFFPNVTVVDSAGDSVLSDVSFVDLNTASVRFGAPVAGTAYLS